MTSLITAAALYTGHVTVKERCHDFNCRVVKRFKNQPCRISFDGTRAESFGNSWWMRQFMWGAQDGFHGVNNRITLTMFYKEKRLRVAYISDYDDKSDIDYDRWTCEF